MPILKNLANYRALISYEIAPSQLQQPFISEDSIFLTIVPEADSRVISFPAPSRVDVQAVVENLPDGWYPDIFIAKVNSYFNLVPVNVAALRCPKILVLGDTHHGLEPLQRMISYAQQEEYDFYITDCDRHHLWYFWLAGIKNLYWLPTLLVTPPIANFQDLPYQQKNITNQDFWNKAIFIGSFGVYHPRRRRILEYLSHQEPNFRYGTMILEDCFRAFSQASISLNISLNGDANMRNFEIISAGGFLLSERLSDETGMNLLLEEGKDFEVFSNLQELVDKTKYFLTNPSLSYRQSSYQKHIDSFSSFQSKLMLEKLLHAQDISDIFTIKSIKRIHYFGHEKLSLSRIQLYELIQNIHIFWDNLTIFVDSLVDFAFAIDFLDLSRVEIIIDDNILLENIRNYLVDSNNLSRVKLTQNYLDETFNIIITSTCNPATLDQLIKKNTLIISTDYDGLTRACEHSYLADLQWDQSSLSSDFFVINGNVDKMQLSLINFMTWHSIPITKDIDLSLAELDIRDTNLLLVIDWDQEEEVISDHLLSGLTPIFTSPQVESIALVVCINHQQGEIANLLLSSVVMNILMEKDTEVRGEPGIVFVDITDSLILSAILPKVQYQIAMEMNTLELLPEIFNLPFWKPELLA